MCLEHTRIYNKLPSLATLMNEEKFMNAIIDKTTTKQTVMSLTLWKTHTSRQVPHTS